MLIIVNQMDFYIEYEVVNGHKSRDYSEPNESDSIKITDIHYHGVDVFEIINPVIVQKIVDEIARLAL